MPPLDAISRPPDLRPHIVAPGARIVVPPPLPEPLRNAVARDAVMKIRIISSRARVCIPCARRHSGSQAVARCAAPNPRLVAPRARILLPPPLLKLARNAVRRHVGAQPMVIAPGAREIVRAGRAAALGDAVARDAGMETRVISSRARVSIRTPRGHSGGQAVARCAAPNPRLVAPWPGEIVLGAAPRPLRDAVAWDAVMEMRIVGAGAREGLPGGGAGAYGDGVRGRVGAGRGVVGARAGGARFGAARSARCERVCGPGAQAAADLVASRPGVFLPVVGEELACNGVGWRALLRVGVLGPVGARAGVLVSRARPKPRWERVGRPAATDLGIVRAGPRLVDVSSATELLAHGVDRRRVLRVPISRAVRSRTRIVVKLVHQTLLTHSIRCNSFAHRLTMRLILTLPQFLYHLIPCSSISAVCKSGVVSMGDEQGRNPNRCSENFW
jgi:hypothetical protein